MRVRLRVSCTLGPRRAVVDVPAARAKELIRRGMAEPLTPKAAPVNPADARETAVVTPEPKEGTREGAGKRPWWDRG